MVGQICYPCFRTRYSGVGCDRRTLFRVADHCLVGLLQQQRLKKSNGRAFGNSIRMAIYMVCGSKPIGLNHHRLRCGAVLSDPVVRLLQSMAHYSIPRKSEGNTRWLPATTCIPESRCRDIVIRPASGMRVTASLCGPVMQLQILK